METFNYIHADSRQSAVKSVLEGTRSKFLAGGTNLIDLMKLNIETPRQVIDINGLDLYNIEEMAGGAVRIGALVKNSDLAWHPLVMQRYPVLSEALLSGASAQLRNMASVGGNILQRTRCYYFYDTTFPCNKREPGSGCAAINGYNRNNAILGTSDSCIATHPSDMCVAMAMLDATITILSVTGTERAVPFNEFHLLPGSTPQRENILRHGDLITGVILPAISYSRHSHYLKVRDRASYEFALTSAAVMLDIDGGTIRNARIALGGVGTRPWRSHEAENSLLNKPASMSAYKQAADMALNGSQPHKYNAFKVELAKRTLVRALAIIGEQS